MAGGLENPEMYQYLRVFVFYQKGGKRGGIVLKTFCSPLPVGFPNISNF